TSRCRCGGCGAWVSGPPRGSPEMPEGATPRWGRPFRCTRRWSGLWRSGLGALAVLDRTEDLVDAVLGVAEEHLGVVAEEQRVLHAGVAGGHGALEHDHVGGFPHVQDGHAGDRAARVL